MNIQIRNNLVAEQAEWIQEEDMSGKTTASHNIL